MALQICHIVLPFDKPDILSWLNLASNTSSQDQIQVSHLDKNIVSSKESLYLYHTLCLTLPTPGIAFLFLFYIEIFLICLRNV